MISFPFTKTFSLNPEYAAMRSVTICLIKVANAGYIFAHSQYHSSDIDNLMATLYAGPLAGYKCCEGDKKRTSEVERFTRVIKAMSDHYALSLTQNTTCDSIYVNATSIHDLLLEEKTKKGFSREEKKRKAE